MSRKPAVEKSTVELLIVLPVYNEGPHLESVLKPWFETISELEIKALFLLIDDGSTDNTKQVIEDLHRQRESQILPIFQQNAGHGEACLVGYERAIDMEVPWTLQIDSDGQCDARKFAEFWKQRKEADCIFGERVIRDDGQARCFVSWVLRRVGQFLTGINGRDVNVPYRLMTCESLKRAIQRFPDKKIELVNVLLTFSLKKDGEVRWSYVPIRFAERSGGKGTLNVARIVKFGIVAIREIRALQLNTK